MKLDLSFSYRALSATNILFHPFRVIREAGMPSLGRLLAVQNRAASLLSRILRLRKAT